MLHRITSFFKRHQKQRMHRKTAAIAYRCANLALKKYKIALIDLFDMSGPNKRSFILLKIKAGNIWSRKHYKNFLSRALEARSEITYDECLHYIDYSSLQQEFIDWCKKYFLRQ